MYFPCMEMLPFLKTVDVKTKKTSKHWSAVQIWNRYFKDSIADATDNNADQEFLDSYKQSAAAKKELLH